MKRRIFLFLLFSLLSINTIGQSVDKMTFLSGDWFACDLMSIALNDTVKFTKYDSSCSNSDCLLLKWIINKNHTFKSGWQKGCETEKIGYDLKPNYKWEFDQKNELLILR